MTDQTAVDEDPQTPDIGATLRAALSTGADVRGTAKQRVDRALNARSAASGYTSMLGCAIETLRHLLTNPADPADRYTMADHFDLGASRDDRDHDG